MSPRHIWTAEKIIGDVKEILINILNLDPDIPIRDDNNIFDDFEADSLDLIEIHMSCNEKFDIEIFRDETTMWQTVGDIMKSVKKALKR